MDKKQILIIDDDPDFRLQLRVQLEKLGYSIIEAESAEDGWSKVEANIQHLLLAVVDLMMEESDAGFKLCYRIKKKYPSLPLVIATAVGKETGFEFSTQTQEERNWIKADYVIDKPIRMEQLKTILTQLEDSEL